MGERIDVDFKNRKMFKDRVTERGACAAKNCLRRQVKGSKYCLGHFMNMKRHGFPVK